MNAKQTTVPTRFAPETRFELTAVPAASIRDALQAKFEQLKQRLLRQLLNEHLNPELDAPLRRAANDASALAWTTTFPLLVFPMLLEELAQAAQCQTSQQTSIRLRSRNMVMEVA